MSNKIDTLATTIDEKFANAESSLATTVESRLFERARALIDDRLAATTAAPSADTAPDMNDDDVSAALDRASAALDLELAPRSRLSIDPPGTPVDALPPTRRNTTAGISSDDASRGGIESDSDGDDTNANDNIHDDDNGDVFGADRNNARTNATGFHGSEDGNDDRSVNVRHGDRNSNDNNRIDDRNGIDSIRNDRIDDRNRHGIQNDVRNRNGNRNGSSDDRPAAANTGRTW